MGFYRRGRGLVRRPVPRCRSGGAVRAVSGFGYPARSLSAFGPDDCQPKKPTGHGTGVVGRVDAVETGARAIPWRCWMSGVGESRLCEPGKRRFATPPVPACAGHFLADVEGARDVRPIGRS